MMRDLFFCYSTWGFGARWILICSVIGALAGCGSMPSSGPNRSRIQNQADESVHKNERVALVNVTSNFARYLQQSMKRDQFSTAFSDGAATSYAIGRGDMLDITLWEAPPAMLFNGGGNSVAGALVSSAAPAVVTLPAQMVNSDGTIVVPYAGNVMAAGRSTQEIQAEIVRKLKGKANHPQALVRIAANASSTVTVVGEVKSDTRMPLTPGGERLLDALAHTGGPTQPVNKTTIQLTRNGKSQAMPLTAVITDPSQNVRLRAGDVITVVSQSLSFTALGASGKSDEINFEASGITLAQALARMGGLQDNKADASGIFIFRFEDATLFDARLVKSELAPDGKIPVVYQVDIKNPASFFAAQRFPIKDKDVIYVATAPAAEFQKFLNIVLSGVYPIAYILNGTW